MFKCFLFEGVTSNTDAAQLAETFAESKCTTKVLPICTFEIVKTEKQKKLCDVMKTLIHGNN